MKHHANTCITVHYTHLALGYGILKLLKFHLPNCTVACGGCYLQFLVTPIGQVFKVTQTDQALLLQVRLYWVDRRKNNL